MFGRIAAWATRHARIVLGVSVVLAVVAGFAATRLPTDAGTGTLVDSDTSAARASAHVRQVFGEDPVVVLAEGRLRRLVLTANLLQLLRLEGCLAGNVPKGAKPIPGPCTELARLGAVKSISGPATFLNEAVIAIDRQIRRLAADKTPAQLRSILVGIATQYGITSLPSLGNIDFISSVVFDPRRPLDAPKAKLAYLFPNNHSAQIVVRLRPDLSESERHRALELIRAAVFDTTPRGACSFNHRPASCFELHGGRYVVSGAPVVVDGLAGVLKDALLVLFGVAMAVMALTLLTVFRSRLRLLPLGVALCAAALTFGLLGLVGGSLTMASIAVLPVLIGLAVDYAIQLQARYDEAITEGLQGAEAARQAAARGGPTIGIACLATAAGFLALQLSPTPMVRSFGLLLIAGIGIAFALAMTFGFAALSQRKSQPAEGGLARLPARFLAVAVVHPRRVLGIGFALAVIGWGVGTQIETQSDIRKLVPPNLREVRDLNELQDVTGVSGELDVSVEAPDLADPDVIRWMAGFKQRVLNENGFAGLDPSCRDAEVCPGPALSDFIAGGPVTKQRVQAVVSQLPAYDLKQVAAYDPRTGALGHTALLAFGIRAQSLDAQQALIDRIKSEIGSPPPGVTVRLAGLPVIAAESATDLSHSRYWLTLAGLAAVALTLLLVYRSASRTLVPLVPIVLATGWSALVLWAIGIPLNPMSAALGALVVAIATEFSVILAARFHEEQEGGHSVEVALRRAYARTGAAVLASGMTATAGFAVLIASDIRMLRDFGFVTVIDLAVALLGVMLVLPAALVWARER
jgi:uncharacterized protein